MIDFLVKAIVSVLVFFFEQWWASNHPVKPTEMARAAFFGEMNSRWGFKLVPKALREKHANIVFDKFVDNYVQDPPVVDLSSAPLSADEARALAQRYAVGI